jgi:hypothetical protein
MRMATEVLLYLVIVLLIMQVVFIGIVINLQMKHKRMQAKYQIFMRGKDGKSLEKGFLEQFKTVEKLERAVKQNTRDIDTIYKRMKTHYQKIGIVRYDAFQEMGGNLSFVLTMLDENNNVIGTVWPGKSDVYHAFQSTWIPYGTPYISIASDVKQYMEVCHQ